MILVCLLLVVDSLDVLISAQSRKFRMKWGEMSRRKETTAKSQLWESSDYRTCRIMITVGELDRRIDDFSRNLHHISLEMNLALSSEKRIASPERKKIMMIFHFHFVYIIQTVNYFSCCDDDLDDDKATITSATKSIKLLNFTIFVIQQQLECRAKVISTWKTSQLLSPCGTLSFDPHPLSYSHNFPDLIQ